MPEIAGHNHGRSHKPPTNVDVSVLPGDYASDKQATVRVRIVDAKGDPLASTDLLPVAALRLVEQVSKAVRATLGGNDGG